jgi:hypothetical protein
MITKEVLEVIAVVALAFPVMWGGKVFYVDHLPEFRLVQAKQLFDDCMAECIVVCHATCKLNEPNKPVEQCKCNCSHCHRFIHTEDH